MISEIYNKFYGNNIKVEMPNDVFVEGRIIDCYYEPEENFESLILEIENSN